MSEVEQLYRWLAGDVSPAANEILSAALAHAEADYASRIATMLLSRRHESAWRGLVGNYERLTPELREQLLVHPGLVRAGLAAAMRDTNTQARQNALALLHDWPCPHVSYLVADALRDNSPEIRTAAALVLRRCAEIVLDRAEGEATPDQSSAADMAAERVEVVKAIREGLRTFGLHGQLGVLEASLWFAKELGTSLWDALADRHSRCGGLLERHVAEWNHPRLAGFLLLGLAQPAWHATSRDMLTSWQTQPELLAILRNSDLLADPLVRQGLRDLHQPRWFVAADPSGTDLPPDARAQLPRWVCVLEFSLAERLRYLEHCGLSSCPQVQRAAVYALASLNVPEAAPLLARTAAHCQSMARFVRWFLIGRRALDQAGLRVRGTDAGQVVTSSRENPSNGVTT